MRLRSVRKPIVSILSLSAFFSFAAFNFTFFGVLFPSPVKADTIGTPLQVLIDRAKAGDTVMVPPGTYEGPVILSKPIRLQASGTVELVGTAEIGDKPILSILTNGAQIDNLILQDRRSGPETVSILIHGNDNRVESVQIASRGIGIKLEQSRRNRLDGIKIRAAQTFESRTLAFDDRGNGIELWDSHDNLILDSRIVGAQDGIYMENSNSTRLLRNHVSDSRYAFHLMYAIGTSLKQNESESNVTGAMIMETDNTLVEGNRFEKSSRNVHSQGILLFEAKHTRITANLLQGNRVGLYMEQSSDNQIDNNRIVQNFVGLQLIGASRNELHHNDLLSNVVQAQAESSADNRLHDNYWDDHAGIDFRGSGQSDLPYSADPFFLTLANSFPPFQLFFHSPGMLVLEELFQTDTKNWLSDKSPQMNPVHPLSGGGESGRGTLLLFSAVLFVVSVIPFLLSFRFLKKE